MIFRIPENADPAGLGLITGVEIEIKFQSGKIDSDIPELTPEEAKLLFLLGQLLHVKNELLSEKK